MKGLNTEEMKIVLGVDSQEQVWDEHGILCRRYDPVTESYGDTQLKIVNSTMAITDDAWKTVKTAVGLYYYYDPVTGKLKSAYGVNGETIVGKLILGEELGIYNEDNNLTFNKDGFKISNGINSFEVNPNSNILLSISKDEEKIFYVDENGKLYITGDGSGIDIAGSEAYISLTNGLADGTTIVSGGCIQTGTIDANVANIVNINASNITTGTLAAERIDADNLCLTGSININDNFIVDSYGNVTMRGNLTLSGNSYISWSDLDYDTQQVVNAANDNVKALANGTYTGGTFISGTSIYSPNLCGDEFGLLDGNGGSVGTITLRTSNTNAFDITSKYSIRLTAETGYNVYLSNGVASISLTGSENTESSQPGDVSLTGQVCVSSKNFGTTLPTSNLSGGRIFFKIG